MRTTCLSTPAEERQIDQNPRQTETEENTETAQLSIIKPAWEYLKDSRCFTDRNRRITMLNKSLGEWPTCDFHGVTVPRLLLRKRKEESHPDGCHIQAKPAMLKNGGANV